METPSEPRPGSEEAKQFLDTPRAKPFLKDSRIHALCEGHTVSEGPSICSFFQDLSRCFLPSIPTLNGTCMSEDQLTQYFKNNVSVNGDVHSP